MLITGGAPFHPVADRGGGRLVWAVLSSRGALISEERIDERGELGLSFRDDVTTLYLTRYLLGG